MSKSKKNKGVVPVKQTITYDFSSLLTYCSPEEIGKFKEGLNQPSVSSLILNAGKYTSSQLEETFSDLKKDDTDPLLYRFSKEEDRMGKTLEHFAGAFYILDPSSGVISSYLEKLLPKDFVSLDLCAAPGGKTIAMDLRRKDGLYLANDIAFDRAIEISKNAQRLALSNILTLSIDPVKLSLPEMFDLVILDAPCSGSGMIRKEPKMAKDYSEEKVTRLLPIQENLLEKAYECTKKDGIIAYSTCSLSIKEDEEQVMSFMKRHPDVEMIPLSPKEGMVIGKENIGYHMIPGIYDGEGIYFVLLRKTKGDVYQINQSKEVKKYNDELMSLSFKGNTYLLSRFYQEFSKLPFIAPGMKVYDKSEHPKCEYDHAYSKVSDDIQLVEIDRQAALSYVQGNEVKVDASIKDGLVILAYQKMRLGLGKNVKGKVKNYLPKGLRSNLY